MRNLSTILLLCLLCLNLRAQGTNYYTPAQYLAMQPTPHFALGNHLPRLTVCGWPLPTDLLLRMTTNWDYCFDFNTINPAYSSVGKNIRIAAADTNNLPVCLHVTHSLPAYWNIGDGMWCLNSAGQIVDSASNVWANVSSNYSKRVVSPEAPDSEWTNAAAHTAAEIATVISSNVNVAIVLNDGEYGLSVIGNAKKAWINDPRVQAAMATNGLSYARYCSVQKARQMGFVSAAIRAAVPNRQIYIWYATGAEQSKYIQPGYPTNWTDANAWGFASEYMNPKTDLPCFEDYYQGPQYFTNSYTNPFNVTDLLTKHLDAVGYDYAIGNSNLSYSYVCGGYSIIDTNHLADIATYMGFLKCLYTAGMSGAVAGYFSYPTGTVASVFGENGFAGSFPTNIPPHWLLQVIALSRVHALFSYQDSFLNNSILLSGNGVHFMSRDQTSYEFTNSLANKNIRTLARQATTGNTNRWLICCWAPFARETNVTVNIAALGAVNLIARPSGAVYLATPTTLTLQDTNGVLPTEWMTGSQSLSPPHNLRIFK